jgi:hypothetical protein
MAPEPNDQMIDPEIGNEELDAWLAQLNDQEIQLPALMSTHAGQVATVQDGNDDDNQDDEPGTQPDSDGDDDEEEEQQTTTPAEGVDFFTINGQQFPRSDIERLYNFDQFMRQNPDAALRVAEAIKPTADGQPPVSETTPTTTDEEWVEPTPPETLDLDDPMAKFTWDSMVSLQKSQFELGKQQKQFLTAQARDRQEQVNRQAAVDMDVALTQFRQQYPGLNDDDIATIRQEAIPFVDGMMRQLPPVDALKRSMEVAAFANTDLRPRLESETKPPTTHQRSTRRKQKLDSISGSPRSAPKVDTKPSFSNDRDMVNAFANALNDQMTGR